MTTPLLTRDLAALQSVVRPRWQRRAGPYAIVLAATVVLGVHASATPSAVCTEAAPCAADPVGSFVIGLLLAAALAGTVHPGTAAWLAGIFLALLVGYGRVVHPGENAPIWVYLVDLAFISLCVALARLGRWRTTPASQAWLAAVTRTQVPASLPTATVRPARALRAVAVVCGVLGLLSAGWAYLAQSSVDDQQAAAARVTAVVVAHPDDVTIKVRVPGDPADTDIPVNDSAVHPVGQKLVLYRDDRGLRQPVSEPYDATGWLALGVILFGIGLACWARDRDKAALRRDFLTTEQPVTTAYLWPGMGLVAAYPVDARPGEAAAADIACELRLDDAGPQPIRLGRLVGVPVPGAWCTVEVDGRVATPVRPLRYKVLAPPFSGPHQRELDEFGPADPPADLLPLREEQIAAIRPDDLDPNPHQVHIHRQHRIVSYGLALGMPLVLAGLPLPLRLPFVVWLGVAAVAAVLSFTVVGAIFRNGRVAWNGAGVAVVGVGGARRVPWSEVSRVQRDGNIVIVHIAAPRGGGERMAGTGPTDAPAGGPSSADTPIAVTAAGLWRFRGGERGPDQLANALRHAREQALAHGVESTVDIPPVPSARPGSLFYPLLIVYIPPLAWALQVFAR